MEPDLLEVELIKESAIVEKVNTNDANRIIICGYMDSVMIP